MRRGATFRSDVVLSLFADGRCPAGRGPRSLPPGLGAAAVLRCERARGKPAVPTRLLRSFLRRYVRQVTVVMILLVAQAIGNLYRPSLNAGVIDDGVEKGSVRYIWTTGGTMLAVALAAGAVPVVAVSWSSRVAMGAGADRARVGGRAACLPLLRC